MELITIECRICGHKWTPNSKYRYIQCPVCRTSHKNPMWVTPIKKGD